MVRVGGEFPLYGLLTVRLVLFPNRLCPHPKYNIVLLMVFRDISLMEVIHSALIRILSLTVIKVCSVTTNSFNLPSYNHTNDVLNQVSQMQMATARRCGPLTNLKIVIWFCTHILVTSLKIWDITLYNKPILLTVGYVRTRMSIVILG
jgi:hypothetical protein